MLPKTLREALILALLALLAGNFVYTVVQYLALDCPEGTEKVMLRMGAACLVRK